MERFLNSVLAIGLTALGLVSPSRGEAIDRQPVDMTAGAPVHVAGRFPLGSTCTGFGDSFDLLPAHWGSIATSDVEPTASACGADGASIELVPGEVAVIEGRSVQVASVEERRARRGGTRALDVSFLVPSESFAEWSHTAAFAAFDDSNSRFRRLGAAVFAATLYVELVDDDCSPTDNLLAGVPVPGGIQPDHWYRLYADFEPAGPERRISVAVADLETLEMLAETGWQTTCRLGWAASARTSAAFLAEVPAGDEDARPRVLLDDYFASVRRGGAP